MQQRTKTAILIGAFLLSALWLIRMGGPEVVQAQGQFAGQFACVEILDVDVVWGMPVLTGGSAPDVTGVGGLGPGTFVTQVEESTGAVHLSHVGEGLGGTRNVTTFSPSGIYSSNTQVAVAVDSWSGATCFAGIGLTGGNLVCRAGGIPGAATEPFVVFTPPPLNEIAFDPDFENVLWFVRDGWVGTIILDLTSQNAMLREYPVAGNPSRIALAPGVGLGTPWFDIPDTQHIGTLVYGKIPFSGSDQVVYYPVPHGSFQTPTPGAPRGNGILPLGNGNVLAAASMTDHLLQLDPAADMFCCFPTGVPNPLSLAEIGDRIAFNNPLGDITTVNRTAATFSSCTTSSPLVTTPTLGSSSLPGSPVTAGVWRNSIGSRDYHILGTVSTSNASVSYQMPETTKSEVPDGLNSFGSNLLCGHYIDGKIYEFDEHTSAIDNNDFQMTGSPKMEGSGREFKVQLNTGGPSGKGKKFTVKGEGVNLVAEDFKIVERNPSRKLVKISGTWKGGKGTFGAAITDGGVGEGLDTININSKDREGLGNFVGTNIKGEFTFTTLDSE